MKPYAQIAADRKAAILKHAPLTPKGRCHFCDYELLIKGALWCGYPCAQEFVAERDELINALPKPDQQPSPADQTLSASR